ARQPSVHPRPSYPVPWARGPRRRRGRARPGSRHGGAGDGGCAGRPGPGQEAHRGDGRRPGAAGLQRRRRAGRGQRRHALRPRRRPGAGPRLEHQVADGGRGDGRLGPVVPVQDGGVPPRSGRPRRRPGPALPQGLRRPDDARGRLPLPRPAGPCGRHHPGDRPAGRRRQLLRRPALQPRLVHGLRRRLLRGGDLRADGGAQRRPRLRHGAGQLRTGDARREGPDHDDAGVGGPPRQDRQPDHHGLRVQLEHVLRAAQPRVGDDHRVGPGAAGPQPRQHARDGAPARAVRRHRLPGRARPGRRHGRGLHGRHRDPGEPADPAGPGHLDAAVGAAGALPQAEQQHACRGADQGDGRALGAAGQLVGGPRRHHALPARTGGPDDRRLADRRLGPHPAQHPHRPRARPHPARGAPGALVRGVRPGAAGGRRRAADGRRHAAVADDRHPGRRERPRQDRDADRRHRPERLRHRAGRPALRVRDDQQPPRHVTAPRGEHPGGDAGRLAPL
ncbi:MAG: D-alanyl-D-alanine carboxypeptidase, partial [uncultured Friedmanniella sp.]